MTTIPGGASAIAAKAPSRSGVSDRDWIALRGRLEGRLLRAGDAGYLEQVVSAQQRWSVAPSATAVCAGVPDVRAALEFAREHSLPFAVRGGGHCYAGFTSSVAELVIDVSGMRRITVDTEAGTVRVQAGARSGSVAAALADTGAMIPLGRCPTVGMSGFTLGGGWSLYAREHGMACDKVRELTVVTATGDVLKCDERTNSDLFWALRGAGHGSFGIVTELVFDLADAPTSSVAALQFPVLSRTAELLKELQSIMVASPAEVGLQIVLSPTEANRMGNVNPPLVLVLGHYTGRGSDLEELLAPLARDFGAYNQVFQQSDFWKSHRFLRDSTPYGLFGLKCSFVEGKLSDDGIDAWVRQLGRYPGSAQIADQSAMYLFGGAASRPASDANAYVHRNADLLLRFEADWGQFQYPPNIEANLEWLEASYEAMRPHVLAQSYQNFQDRSLKDWANQYYATNLPRLRRIKRQVDPDDVFHFPQSIPL